MSRRWVKHRQRQLRFALKLPFILRYRGFFAALVIVTPIRRQIEPRVDQRCHVAPAQGCEYTHLTVIDFPQTAIPLSGNAGRCLAVLGKAAFVKNQDRVSTAQQRVGFLSNLSTKHLSTKPLPINAFMDSSFLQAFSLRLLRSVNAVAAIYPAFH